MSSILYQEHLLQQVVRKYIFLIFCQPIAREINHLTLKLIIFGTDQEYNRFQFFTKVVLILKPFLPFTFSTVSDSPLPLAGRLKSRSLQDTLTENTGIAARVAAPIEDPQITVSYFACMLNISVFSILYLFLLLKPWLHFLQLMRIDKGVVDPLVWLHKKFCSDYRS